MVPDSLIASAEDVIEYLKSRGLRLNVVESGMGGLASAVLTTISGCSAVFEQGLVCYSNASKVKLLGVSEQSLIDYGAVSEEVVAEMARGGLGEADLCLAESCIAGPNGGSKEKPVGLCQLALASKNGSLEIRTFQFRGDRRSIRVQAVSAMLDMLMEV